MCSNMENAETDEQGSIRHRKCPTCGTDFKPPVEISIPGLNRLFNTSYAKTMKIVWLSTMIICIVVCICLTVYQLQVYFKYPVTSKTFITRKQNVQFPAFSACTYYDARNDNNNIYIKLLRKEIIDKCHRFNIDNCETNFDSITLSELGINLQQIWDQCHFKSVSTVIESVNNESNRTEITRRHSALGSCTDIKHTGRLTYLSALLEMDVIIKSEGITDILFIPHGIPEFESSDYDLLRHEMEYLHTGSETQLRIQEEMNTTERKCYDYDTERKRIQLTALEFIRKHGACRLPYLPDCFPECQTFADVRTSIHKVFSALTEMLLDPSWSTRSACEYQLYPISLDYVVPLDAADKEDNVTVTKFIIKFADDTNLHITEQFTYSLPELVGDLLAYWAFFLCLSAPVFVEIIECLSIKIYKVFKNQRKHKQQT